MHKEFGKLVSSSNAGDKYWDICGSSIQGRQKKQNKTKKQAEDRTLDGSKEQEDPPKRMRQIIKEEGDSVVMETQAEAFEVSQMWERDCGGGQRKF